jgi:hypothetical protein
MHIYSIALMCISFVNSYKSQNKIIILSADMASWSVPKPRRSMEETTSSSQRRPKAQRLAKTISRGKSQR